MKSVALLATGNELISGQTLNTNSTRLSQILTEHGVNTLLHLAVGDSLEEIITGLEFVSKHADVIIITGGLGPTSDDNTKKAVSLFLQLPLEFSSTSWETIQERLARFDIKVHPNNKVQAYFPQTSNILKNDFGSAAGCYIKSQEKLYFLLPGPPNECLPMFNNQVLPILEKNNYFTEKKLLYWRLLGVNEADIGAIFDSLANNSNIVPQYCWEYPYLDCKLWLEEKELSLIAKQLSAIEAELKANLVSHAKIEASTLLSQLQQKLQVAIILEDNLTKGDLARLISDCPNTKNIFKVKAYGMDEYWLNKPFIGTTTFNITVIRPDGQQDSYQLKVPYRQREIRNYALEYASFAILQSMNSWSHLQKSV